MKNLLTTHRPLKIHCIGIGGTGMCGLAEILVALGHQVSGSDMTASATTDRLRTLGIDIHIGHEAKWVVPHDLIVVSSAIPLDNVELKEAQFLNKPLVSRGQLLAEIVNARKNPIVIAGTHGKTTTTAMLIELFIKAHLQPSYSLGGELNLTQNHGALTQSNWMIVESDESDGSFLLLNPYIGVITHLDNDHLNHYAGNIQQLVEAFQQFTLNIQVNGYLIVFWDNPYLQKIVANLSTLRPDITLITYGLTAESAIYPQTIQYAPHQTTFAINRTQDALQDTEWFELKAYGQHNVLNALACIAVAHTVKEITPEVIRTAFKNFSGVKRRFQVSHIRQMLLIEDYAHHPTELTATYLATQKAFPDRPILTIFQPHKYSRTQDCYEQFLLCFGQMQEIWLLDIYAAGELPIEGVRSEILATEATQRFSQLKVRYIPQISSVLSLLDERQFESPIVLCLGAGSIGSLPTMIHKHYSV
ncbi:MAG: UDP-N-acetylmuramate--L-alanine ligase [Gammaproteobacteria bacterium]|nr:UDP-N-acetylmuramate--L-alanine ligase [Gammaproteobacteria bacterium]